MTEQLKPCGCGHSGGLLGTDTGTSYTLQCPACSRSVSAFTPTGLVAEWNATQRPAEVAWPEDDGSGKAGESRIERVANSHGDGEHYALLGQAPAEDHPHRCRYCGAGSYLDPADQSPPPDYCHESDHGDREEWLMEQNDG